MWGSDMPAVTLSAKVTQNDNACPPQAGALFYLRRRLKPQEGIKSFLLATGNTGHAARVDALRLLTQKTQIRSHRTLPHAGQDAVAGAIPTPHLPSSKPHFSFDFFLWPQNKMAKKFFLFTDSLS